MELVERTRVLPGRLIVLTVRAQPVPVVEDDDAIDVRKFDECCFGMTARHGFMETPDIEHFFALATRKGLELRPDRVYFYLSRMTSMPTGMTQLAQWRKLLFAFMYHNARPTTSYFHLPPNRVIELGRLVELWEPE